MGIIDMFYGKKQDSVTPSQVNTVPTTFADRLINGLNAPEQGGMGETEQKVVDAVMWTYEEYKKAAADISSKRERVVKMYNGDYGFSSSKRQNWQSQRNFPQVRVAVKKLAARIMKIFTRSKNNWFDLYSYNTGYATLYPLFKKMLAKSLDHPKTNFLHCVKGAIINGILYSVAAVQLGWAIDDVPAYAVTTELKEKDVVPDFLSMLMNNEQEKEEDYISRSYPVVKNVNPDYVYLDSTGRDRNKVHVYYLTKGEYRELADSMGLLYTDEVLSSAVTSQEYATKMTNSRQVSDNGVAKLDSIKIIEHYGDLYNDEGFKVQSNSYVIVANEKYPVFISDNPYPHGEISLLTCSMESDPQAVYTESTLSASIDTIELWVKFLNLLVDFYHSRVITMFEKDTSNIENPEEITALYPGMTINKLKETPAITPVQLGDLPQGAWQFIQILNQEKSDDTGLQEIINNKQSGAVTASAVLRGAGEESAVFDDMFKQLEESFFSPLLRQTFLNMLYFMPDDEWDKWMDNEVSKEIQTQLDKISPEAYAQAEQQAGPDQAKQQLVSKIKDSAMIKLYLSLKGLSGQARIDKFGKHFQFKTDVLSAFFDQQTFLENMNYYIAIVAKNPMLASKTNWDYLLRCVVKTLGFDESQAILSDDKAANVLKTMQSLGILNAGKMTTQEEGLSGEGSPNQALAPGQAKAAGAGSQGAVPGMNNM